MTDRIALLGGVDWADGQVLYASELNGAFNSTNVPTILKNICILSDNASRTSDATNDYLTFDPSANLDETNSTGLKESKAFCVKVDDFSAGSINTGIWTVTSNIGTVTQSGGNMHLHCSNNLTMSIKFGITDGTNTVLFDNIGSNQTLNRAYRIVINKASQTIKVYSTLSQSTPDLLNGTSISTLSKWQIYAYCSANGGSTYAKVIGSGASATDYKTLSGNSEIVFKADLVMNSDADLYLYEYGHIIGAVGTSYLQTTAQTINSSSKAFLKYDITQLTANQALGISCDNGSNYQTISASNAIKSGFTAGTQLKAKVTGTHLTSIDANGKNIETLALNKMQAITLRDV